MRSDGILVEGDVLLDKYRVERVLGIGGMGYVVQATHTELRQQVAIKVLNPDLREETEAVARFLREARASVKIRGEHVVRVLDVGTFPVAGPFMVMEFLSGVDLSQELEQRGPLPVETAIDYVLQACEAIAEAHSIGIVHRDLKPANLFLCRRPDSSPLIKVLDFGISKGMTLAHDWPELTGDQAILGSPQYMSPEQVKNPKDVDVRSDIWSLGILLWELLTGTPPFSGLTPISLFTAIVSDPPKELSEQHKDVPPDLQAVVLRCLEKAPGNRYQTVAEFADALLPFSRASGRQASQRISNILRSQPDRKDGTLKSASPTPREARSVGDTLPNPKNAVASISAPQPSDTRASGQDSIAPQASTAATEAARPFRWLLLGALILCIALLGYWVVPRSTALLPKRASAARAEPPEAPAPRAASVDPQGPPVRVPALPALQARTPAEPGASTTGPSSSTFSPSSNASTTDAKPAQAQTGAGVKLRRPTKSAKPSPPLHPAILPKSDPLDGRR